VFRLTSGKLGAYYIDCRKVSLHPEGASLIGTLLLNELQDFEVNAIGGLTLGADPVVTSVAIASFQQSQNPINAFIVRKQAKEHGKNQGIEGPDLQQNAKVAIVDDVITTGGSAIQAAKRVEAAGAQVECILSIVDRLEGGREAMEDLGYKVKSLFTIEDLGVTKKEIEDFNKQVESGEIVG
jgi:orotate phosphoribosyltransferase